MINYAEKIFIRQYMHEDKKLYAAFHPEVILNSPQYETTGRYLVVLLHPEKGLESFFLNENSNTHTWEMDENDPAIVEEELLEWCSNQISAHLHRDSKAVEV